MGACVTRGEGERLEISSVSVWALVVVVTINTLFIAGLAVALFMINARLADALRQAAPLIEKTNQTLARVEETTSQLQQRVDQTLERTTDLVERISERVDTTTALAEEAVTEPLIGAVSIMAGINRGLQTYAERKPSAVRNPDPVAVSTPEA